MSDNYNIDDILAEFADYSDNLGSASVKEPVKAAPAKPAAAPAPVSKPAPLNSEEDPFAVFDSKPYIRPSAEETAPAARAKEAPRSKADPDATRRYYIERRSAPVEEEYDDEEESVGKSRSKRPAVKIHSTKEVYDYEDEEDEEDEEEFHRPHAAVRALVALIFAVISLGVFAWSGMKLSLDHGSAAAVTMSQNQLDMASKLDVFVNNSTADALGDLAFIKKIYTIPATATVAPAPNAAKYGSVAIGDAAQILDVIEQARRSGLLDDQDVIFDPNVEFFEASDIQYYCDDTILAICWKQLVDGRICSMSEIKIADASQIRRKIVNDTFGSGERLFATELAASCNAVVAMNADFYGFRDLGLSVYQGQICRYDTHCDVLYIDRNGDFIIQKRDEIISREDAEQIIADNGVQFTIAFGPVIVENGEAVHLTDGYGGLGEMGMEYSRAGIAQVDTLHYLYMTVSHSDLAGFYAPRATVNQFADIFAGFGVKTAYNLDGGQTGELVFRGEPFNHIDFGSERTVSDIIYFATALPEDQR